MKTDYLLFLDNYFEVKNALIQSDGNLTSTKATELLTSLEGKNRQTGGSGMDVHIWFGYKRNNKKNLKQMLQNLMENENENSQQISFHFPRTCIVY